MTVKEEVVKEYNKLAKIYDTRWKDYNESTAKVSIKLLNPNKNDVILDVSGGTGLLTEKIAKKCRKVYLIDISQGMLKAAKKRLRNFKNVKTDLGSADALNLKPNSFDKAVNNSSFHYYDKPNKVLSEFNRILKPGGKLIIIDWCNDSLYFKIFNLFMRLFKKAYVKSYSSKELKKLLIKNNFRIEKLLKWKLGLWSLMAIKAKKLK